MSKSFPDRIQQRTYGQGDVSDDGRVRPSSNAPSFQERVRAGLKRAKSEGKQLGRPRIAPDMEERIRKALATPGRPGVRVIAKQFGIDPGTVQRISRPFESAANAV
jgi:hypothetical protein